MSCNPTASVGRCWVTGLSDRWLSWRHRERLTQLCVRDHCLHHCVDHANPDKTAKGQGRHFPIYTPRVGWAVRHVFALGARISTLLE